MGNKGVDEHTPHRKSRLDKTKKHWYFEGVYLPCFAQLLTDIMLHRWHKRA